MRHLLLMFSCSIVFVVWSQWFVLDVLRVHSASLLGVCYFWFGLGSLSFSCFLVQGFGSLVLGWFSFKSAVFALVQF